MRETIFVTNLPTCFDRDAFAAHCQGLLGTKGKVTVVIPTMTDAKGEERTYRYALVTCADDLLLELRKELRCGYDFKEERPPRRLIVEDYKPELEYFTEVKLTGLPGDCNTAKFITQLKEENEIEGTDESNVVSCGVPMKEVPEKKAFPYAFITFKDHDAATNFIANWDGQEYTFPTTTGETVTKVVNVNRKSNLGHIDVWTKNIDEIELDEETRVRTLYVKWKSGLEPQYVHVFKPFLPDHVIRRVGGSGEVRSAYVTFRDNNSAWEAKEDLQNMKHLTELDFAESYKERVSTLLPLLPNLNKVNDAN